MRDLLERQAVDVLAGLGRNPSEIARLTRIPRSTVRDWLRQPVVTAEDWARRTPPNPRNALPAREYAYLLGMYLGDGHISRGPRCYRLRITADAAYPAVIDECVGAMRAVLRHNKVSVHPRRDGSRTVDISVYSQALPWLFPQHGSGMKHARKIQLLDWQQAIVDQEPELFLRGLLHSDGCRTTNRVSGYEYSRYFFSQVSDDIRRLFEDTCRRLGITVTSAGHAQLSINRREDVVLVDGLVGPKA